MSRDFPTNNPEKFESKYYCMNETSCHCSVINSEGHQRKYIRAKWNEGETVEDGVCYNSEVTYTKDTRSQ